ncbi:c-type cytochrome [Hymenobacter bucti]|uniref:C-type cytochrome n=1 Tax=Hymenobacter bucti TaxID=1844114 RepID=A0ABW4QXS7_9BACT
MRTNLTGFALTVGMGLIVVLIGFLGLSAAGLVGFSATDAQTEQAQPTGAGTSPAPTDSTDLLVSAKSKKPLAPGEKAAIEAGDALFKANCTQCHAVNEKVVGPALAGITKRRPASWLVSWVHNPAKVIASGDAYAVKLFDDYGKQQMPSFPQLSDKDIKNIVAWVEAQEGSADSSGTDAGAVAVNTK